jgi:hypothetical protein
MLPQQSHRYLHRQLPRRRRETSYAVPLAMIVAVGSAALTTRRLLSGGANFKRNVVFTRGSLSSTLTSVLSVIGPEITSGTIS